MGDKYVSLAIDHGTSNSCIAVMSASGPRVLQAEPEGLILPSVVFYDAKGGLGVGSQARRAMLTSRVDQGTGHFKYKLRIGTNWRYEFKAAGKSLTAPELGGIIIQSLLRTAFKESGVDAKACVITIPATFSAAAVEGTRAAAAMAGLKYYPLLMEPVAAAMRYGFNAAGQRAQWMVFDLGGGTLDVSLVIARRGKMAVPDGGHAGDDDLGGSKFDADMANYVLTQLEGTYALSTFRANRGGEVGWGRLLLAVEEAKIALTTKQEAVVSLDEPLCRDDRGRDVLVNLSVTRRAYEDLIRPSAERAVHICRTLLKNNRLAPDQVEKLILIGGPSKTPLIQRMLSEQLGIRLELSIDPMTAVAEGAAIYADTLELPAELIATSSKVATGHSIRIESERHSAVPTYCAVGVVDGPTLSRLRVEVERLDGLWKSREIPVDPSGVFTVDLALVEGEVPTLSAFRVTLLDGAGKILLSVNEPQIWHPYPVVENRLASSYRVAIKNGRTKVLIEHGAVLPASGSGEFVTVKPLKKGSAEDVLRIPVLESVANLLGHEDNAASSCMHVGTLRIHGSDQRVTMNLPEGSDIQVALRVDTSRNIKAVASITLLDAEFEATFVGETFLYDLTDLGSRSDAIQYQLDEISKLQAKSPSPVVADTLAAIERTQLKTGIEIDFERAGCGDRDAEVRGYKRLLEMEGTIHELQRLQRRTSIESAIDALRRVVRGDVLRTLDEIADEYASAVTEDSLARCLSSIRQLEFNVRGKPWADVRIDVMALSGLKVSAQQHALFEKATGLLDSLDAKGGIEALTDADITALTKVHHELSEAHDDLRELRARAFESLGIKDSEQLTDIDAAGA